MKTSFLTIITAAILVAGLANNSNAATVKNDDSNYTVLTDVKSVNRIEVRGNVEVYVSDAATDEVKVYNKYYNESALVQNTNGVLRITSYKAEKMVVWVKANDLRSIAAYDNAEVKSFGKLSKIDLDVELHDNSIAKLDVDAFSANLTVKDHAKADLTGTTEQYNLKRDAWATVNNNNFKAARTIKNEVTFASEDLAGI